MAEYIERSAAIKAAKHAWAKGLEPSQYIEALPAADVAPVVNGRWIETPRLYYGAKQYECSLCCSDTFWNKHSITVKYPHCPNCGCRMDGGVE